MKNLVNIPDSIDFIPVEEMTLGEDDKETIKHIRNHVILNDFLYSDKETIQIVFPNIVNPKVKGDMITQTLTKKEARTTVALMHKLLGLREEAVFMYMQQKAVMLIEQMDINEDVKDTIYSHIDKAIGSIRVSKTLRRLSFIESIDEKVNKMPYVVTGYKIGNHSTNIHFSVCETFQDALRTKAAYVKDYGVDLTCIITNAKISTSEGDEPKESDAVPANTLMFETIDQTFLLAFIENECKDMYYKYMDATLVQGIQGDSLSVMNNDDNINPNSVINDYLRSIEEKIKHL